MNPKFKIQFTSFFIILLAFIWCFNFHLAHAENVENPNPILSNSKVQNYNDLNFDIALAETKYDKYGPVNEISICDITKPSGYNFVSSEQWLSDLYYYMITELHFFDIPFNYVIDGTNFYQTRVGSPIDLQPLAETQENRIIIGVVDLGSQNDIKTKLLLEEIAGFYDIPTNKVTIAECTIQKVNTNSSFISYLKINPTSANILDIFETFGPYKTNSKKYGADLLSTEYNKEVEPFKPLEIKVTLKNTGNSPWYNNSGIIVVTNNEFMKNSEYYYSGSWMSRSHVAQIEDIVPAGEEYTLTIYLQPSPLPISGTEDFILIDPSGTPIKDTAFSVSFSTKDLGYVFVTVKPNAYGFLNVREQPARDAEVITKVEPASVFLLLEQKDGWTKIKVDDQREGWVVSSYVEVMQ